MSLCFLERKGVVLIVLLCLMVAFWIIVLMDLQLDWNLIDDIVVNDGFLGLFYHSFAGALNNSLILDYLLNPYFNGDFYNFLDEDRLDDLNWPIHIDDLLNNLFNFDYLLYDLFHLDHSFLNLHVQAFNLQVYFELHWQISLV
jgi:hypothetical protein